MLNSQLKLKFAFNKYIVIEVYLNNKITSNLIKITLVEYFNL